MHWILQITTLGVKFHNNVWVLTSLVVVLKILQYSAKNQVNVLRIKKIATMDNVIYVQPTLAMATLKIGVFLK
jgi:hypothetical protein